jgi:hypothetical protein
MGRFLSPKGKAKRVAPTIALTLLESKLVETLCQLDVSTHRISQKRDSNPETGNLPIGHIEFHAARFELLAERLQVLHFESDMVDRAPPRACRRRGLERLKAEIHAREVGGQVRSALSSQERKRLHVPIPDRPRIADVVVQMVTGGDFLERRVLLQFYFDVVGTHDVGIREALRPFELAQHRESRGTASLQRLRKVANLEAEMIENGPLTSAGWFLFAEKDERARKLDPGKPVPMQDRRAELLDPEFTLGIQVPDVQMDMTHRHASLVGWKELPFQRREERQCKTACQEQSHDFNGIYYNR